MIREIWKFPFDITDIFRVSLPDGAKILCVQLQGDKPCIWAEVDPMAPLINRRFHVLATGQPVLRSTLESLRYIGTFQMYGFVGHLYDAGVIHATS